MARKISFYPTLSARPNILFYALIHAGAAVIRTHEHTIYHI